MMNQSIISSIDIRETMAFVLATNLYTSHYETNNQNYRYLNTTTKFNHELINIKFCSPSPLNSLHIVSLHDESKKKAY